MLRTFRVLVVAEIFSGFLLSACSFSTIASDVGHAQQSGAEVLQRETTIAFYLCHQEAAFTYFERSLKKLPKDQLPSLQPFDDFWMHDTAKRDVYKRPISWESYCKDLDQTGEIFHGGVLAVGDYARGIAELMDAKTFDGTSLNTIGTGVGAIGTSLKAASTLVTAAQAVGSATSGMAATVTKLIRTHELKEILKDSHKSVTGVLESMDKYLVALDGERRVVAGSRTDAFTPFALNRAKGGGFNPAAEGTMVFDLSTNASGRLERIAENIATDRKLVSLILKAENSLYDAADGQSEQPAQKAAKALSTFVTTLIRQRPEDPWL